jgi:hypothetical protein
VGSGLERADCRGKAPDPDNPASVRVAIQVNPEFPLESAMIAQGFEFTVDSSEGAHTWVSGQPRKICCGLKEQARARWLMEILG